MNPFWLAYFSKGLVQPPTRLVHGPKCGIVTWFFCQKMLEVRLVGKTMISVAMMLKQQVSLISVSELFIGQLPWNIQCESGCSFCSCCCCCCSCCLLLFVVVFFCTNPFHFMCFLSTLKTEKTQAAAGALEQFGRLKLGRKGDRWTTLSKQHLEVKEASNHVFFFLNIKLPWEFDYSFVFPPGGEI